MAGVWLTRQRHEGAATESFWWTGEGTTEIYTKRVPDTLLWLHAQTLPCQQNIL